jgi:acyl-CoA synthetase (AMP-forming)/AMP-acid ligase II
VKRADGFAGYLDDDGELARPALEDGWYATRDHAEIVAGRLELLGRADHAVKRDGMLVRLAELEAKLGDLAGIDRAVVVKSGRTPRGEGLVAWIVPERGIPLDAALVRRAALASLARHAVPDRFVIADALPLLDTGKIDRPSLGARSLENHREGTEHALT